LAIAETSHLEAEEAPPSHASFIPASANLAELTPLHLIVGTLLGIVFGASSLYLVLKVGLTVSASIPVAVISITLFRLLSKLGIGSSTILQNNIVQTAGSAGESLAFGVGATMPAIMILGFDLKVGQAIVVTLLGGLLGILMMIPLRRALIADSPELKYPEGAACAEVLKAGATPEEHALAAQGGQAQTAAEIAASARTIVTGFGVGALYKLAMSAFLLWKDVPTKVFGAPFTAGSISAEISPELLGVGYIIGPRSAGALAGGGLLAYLVLIPAIRFFGGAANVVIPPGSVPIAQMGPDDIRSAYVLYIGAGAVTAGGIISLVRSAPTIWGGLKAGLAAVNLGGRGAAVPARTDRDLPMSVVAGGLIVLMAGILAARSLQMNLMGAGLIVLLGFLFSTVSSRLTGEFGSSSNPVSGMTVATLLFTCLCFLVLGWTGPTYYVTAISVGAIVCIAVANAGTTSQDLKTGFLVGSTPRAQQIAILVGSAASALALAPILIALNQASTVYVPANTLPAPPPVVAPQVLAGLPSERLQGPQAASDARLYRVWRQPDATGAPGARYLVDNQGHAVYLVDPGINGQHKTRPDGSRVLKFDAPKATLMSYIIKGILNRQLPWTLVILGAAIAGLLELCEVPSLAFAVGVYLPVSTSIPIYVGGLIRWLIDRRARGRRTGPLSEAALSAESDRSPGVLIASGYIAGGAIAGVAIAFMAGLLGPFAQAVNAVMTKSNPFFAGPYADALAFLPYAGLVALLYWTGARGQGSSS
jgi:putative OPT family oligopeptide transporter